MKWTGCIILLLSVFLFASAPTKIVWADAGLKEVVAALEEGYNSLNDVRADFSQRTAIASIKKEQRGSGTLLIKKAAGTATMFRFNYIKPQQQIVSNGKSVWFYLPENKQVMVSDAANLFEGESGVTLNYLTGMGHVSRDFAINFVGNGRDKKGNYVLELIPRKKSKVMAKLLITVAAGAVEKFLEEGKARDPFPIVSSVVYDSFGNRTAIEFSKIKANRGMSNALFNFKIPSGVEIIKR
jgi:outer membrane lipoprotein carrier protein